jgi:hypothetical protein
LSIGATADIVRAVDIATDTAFMSGMHTAMTAGVIISVIGAFVSVFIGASKAK